MELGASAGLLKEGDQFIAGQVAKGAGSENVKQQNKNYRLLCRSGFILPLGLAILRLTVVPYFECLQECWGASYVKCTVTKVRHPPVPEQWGCMQREGLQMLGSIMAAALLSVFAFKLIDYFIADAGGRTVTSFLAAQQKHNKMQKAEPLEHFGRLLVRHVLHHILLCLSCAMLLYLVSATFSSSPIASR